jgi:DNA invertase Pin-like site-specific DNA recombinase
MNAVAYLRVSTDAQAQEDKHGLEVQRQDIDEYAQKNGLTITHYYFDAGVSGSKMSRPELDRMIKDAESKTFTQVIVAKLDRVARDTFAQLWIEKELLKSDVEITSVAEAFRANDPAGQLFRTMISAFAQFERARINERMTGGRMQKAKTGNYSGGRPAIGYTADKNNKSLAVNHNKTDLIKLVFELRQQNKSFQQIADALNLAGHTTAKEKTFSKVQVKRIFDRKELYSGIYNYSDIKTEGKHEAILAV